MHKPNVVIENTPYSLLLYWLVENVENTVYILDDTIPIKLIERIRQKNNVFLYHSYYNKNIFYRFLNVYIVQKIKLYFFSKKYISKSSKIFGNDDLILFDRFRKYPYTLIEDGTINYGISIKKKKKGKIKQYIRHKMRGFQHSQPRGISNNCKQIYLTGMLKVPAIIEHKTNIVNLKTLWNKKTEKEQKEILDIFDLNQESMKQIKHKKIILLTQPLSEEGIVSEIEKVEIYKKVLKNYKTEDLLIKVHPKEKTNYSAYFKDIAILHSIVPFELFSMLEMKIECVVTLFSGAALNLDKEIKIDWLGTEFDKRLYQKFGKIDIKT